MKVDGNKDLLQSQVQQTTKGNEAAEARRVGQVQGEDKNQSSSNADTVNISETARKLNELDSAPTDNSARIAELKAAVEEGSYSVDPKQLAAKMIDFEG
jgi:negative regulator of flagellin synthesis FlgM